MNSSNMEFSGVLYRQEKLTWESDYINNLSVGTVVDIERGRLNE
ncbi:hypothetical protein [Photobacterium damselae]|nr:hypothetical protein [Photobacterium damselae]